MVPRQSAPKVLTGRPAVHPHFRGLHRLNLRKVLGLYDDAREQKIDHNRHDVWHWSDWLLRKYYSYNGTILFLLIFLFYFFVAQISLFGLLTSFFILLVNVSVLLFWFVVYSYIRQQGLLKFLPPGLQNMMTQVSFFDILVGIFIERNLSKIVMAIVKPFMNASTPEEVKKTLKKEGKIPTVVYRGLFRKVSQDHSSSADR